MLARGIQHAHVDQWGFRPPHGPGTLALKHMHPYGTLMHMRTTLIIDDELLAKAQQLTGLREKTAVLHAGLQALIARENGRRLAALGGSERSLKPIPRRRSRAA
jgi:Arc/MetJ family transcription regulator